MSQEARATIQPEKIRRFHRLLFRWYRQNARDLPWRHAYDPYEILVSEVMLQQTQVDRVIPKYRAFLKQFPTAKALAGAARADVIRAWSGLGYNRRAICLHQAAHIITKKLGNDFPRKEEEMRRLPGVGQYTAAAIMSFAYNKDTPLADVNMKRVVGRIFVGPNWPRLSEKKMLEVVGQVLPKGKARIFPAAVMDLGAALVRNDPSLASWQKEFPELFVGDERRAIRKESWLGSNRQIRGAILRNIHRESLTLRDLARILGVPLRRTERLVADLARDGLVRVSSGEVGLP